MLPHSSNMTFSFHPSRTVRPASVNGPCSPMNPFTTSPPTLKPPFSKQPPHSSHSPTPYGTLCTLGTSSPPSASSSPSLHMEPSASTSFGPASYVTPLRSSRSFNYSIHRTERMTSAADAWADAVRRAEMPRSIEQEHSYYLARSIAEASLRDKAEALAMGRIDRNEKAVLGSLISPESDGGMGAYMARISEAQDEYSEPHKMEATQSSQCLQPMGQFVHITPPSNSPPGYLRHAPMSYHPIMDSPLYDASMAQHTGSSIPLPVRPISPVRQNIMNQPQPSVPSLMFAPGTNSLISSSGACCISAPWRPAQTNATPPSVFHPMHAVSDAPRTEPSPKSPKDTIGSTSVVPTRSAFVTVSSMHFSANYRGERTVRNCSATIDDSQNCSLWITNLPPDVTTHELLSSIKGIGRVYASVINPPNAASGHVTSAAKVVFFERDAAQAFFVCANAIGFTVRGYAARVSWNRIKSVEIKDSCNKSRVLVLTGFSSVVAAEYMLPWFSRRFKYEIDEVREEINTGVWSKVEYRFGSYRCQAEAAKMAISRELSEHI